MDDNNSRASQEEPVPGSSKTDENTDYRTKKRRRLDSTSSSSSSNSSSDTNSSSSSASDRKARKRKRVRRRHHKKRGGKHTRRSERKIEQLSSEIRELRNQVTKNNSLINTDDALSLYTEDDFEHDLNERGDFLRNLEVGTKLKEPAVPKTDERYLNILKDIQFFNKPDWSEVRYAETQKLYNYNPGFVELEANEEIRSYDTLKHLGYAERAYASLTFGIIKQKEALKRELCEFMTFVKDQGGANIETMTKKINDIYTSGEFSKISADLLQMVCGHRAETIQMRRDGITNAVRDPLVKTSLRKIPPTEINLFNSDLLVTALEKAGGIKKAFWPVSKSAGGPTSQVGKLPIRAARGQYPNFQAPSQGKHNARMPSQGYHTWNAPSQGSNTYNAHCPSQGHSVEHNTCIGHAYHNHSQRSGGIMNRGSFRSRGAKQNQRYQNPKRGGFKRRSSPSGHNDRSKY